MNRNIKLLYGFSFFDQFMIVIALWIPYLTTQGITRFHSGEGVTLMTATPFPGEKIELDVDDPRTVASL